MSSLEEIRGDFNYATRSVLTEYLHVNKNLLLILLLLSIISA